MAARTRWRDLSERNRRLIVTASAVDGILKVAAVLDLLHRPAEQIRGSKRGWATAVVLVNSIGVVPIAYFLFGRRTPNSD